MKNRNFMLTTAALSLLAISPFAAASTEQDSMTHAVKYTGDTKFASFCKAVIENSVSSIRQSANRSIGEVTPSRRGVIRVVSADDGVTCNGKTLIEFSVEKNATDVHAFLVAQR